MAKQSLTIKDIKKKLGLMCPFSDQLVTELNQLIVNGALKSGKRLEIALNI